MSRPARSRRFTRHSLAGEVVLGQLDLAVRGTSQTPHQMRVTVRAEARDIGISAHRAGENAFSFGLLHERARHQALAAEREARRSWRHATRGKARGWLG